MESLCNANFHIILQKKHHHFDQDVLTITDEEDGTEPVPRGGYTFVHNTPTLVSSSTIIKSYKTLATARILGWSFQPLPQPHSAAL